MIVSIMRQLFVLIPAAYILAKLGGLHVVWWSFPIAEVISRGKTLVELCSDSSSDSEKEDFHVSIQIRENLLFILTLSYINPCMDSSSQAQSQPLHL